MATNCRTRRQGDISMYRHLFTAFAMVMAIANGQVEAAGNHTSIAGIGPARWPSTTDPFHKHSGHVLKREGSVLYDELDLLSTKTPSVTNSDIHFNGTLYHYTSEGSNEAIDSSTIVLMSCDGAHAKNTFIRAATEKPKAVIFYTNEGNCCIFNSSYWQLIGPDRPLLFTIANMKVINPPDISGYELATSGTDVQVEYWAHFDADTSSPITAYETPTHEDKDKEKSSAMLIVYIIVSLISAGFVSVMLFLGIKACQRYGGEPTQHLRARPRQSRARGIARAALDALPVVKFGAKPLETTPKDVEMQDGASSLGTGGSTMELRSENGEHVVTTSLSQERVQDMAASTTVEMTSSQTPPPPAYTPTKGPEVPAAEPDPNQVRCPVCLDDFEADQEVRVLPCSHSFHTDCIDPWLLNVAGSCPLCRIDLRSPEERERDNLANILPPPPPALTSRPRSSSVRSGRLQALLDVARGNSSREERLAALRAVRNETGNGNVGRAPRSRRPELGVSRLRRAVFGNGGSDSDSAVDRVPSLRTENSTAGLAQAGAPPGVHSPSSSTAGLG